MRIIGGRSWGVAALAICFSLASCAGQRPPRAARSETQPEEVTQVPLPGSGYVYDVAVMEEAVLAEGIGPFYEEVLTRRIAFGIQIEGYRRLATASGTAPHQRVPA